MQKKVIYLLIILAFLSASSSCITVKGEEESEMPSTITWHSSIKADTVLGWNMTLFNWTDPEKITLPIGDREFTKVGDILQIGYRKAPPTSAAAFFDMQEPPDWVNLFVNTEIVNLTQIDPFMGELLLHFVLPISAQFTNGTTMSLKDYLTMLAMSDNGTQFEEKLDYYYVTTHNEYEGHSENQTLDFSFKCNKATGITNEFSLNDSQYGQLVMQYFEPASTIEEEQGSTVTIESQYTVSIEPPTSTPGFEFWVVLTIALIAPMILKTKKRRSEN